MELILNCLQQSLYKVLFVFAANYILQKSHEYHVTKSSVGNVDVSFTKISEREVCIATRNFEKCDNVQGLGR